MSSLNRKQLPPNNWSCLLYATALICEVFPNKIINFLDHDGSAIIDPNLPEPLKRRGFLPHEMVAFMWYRGIAGITFQRYSVMRCDTEDIIVKNQHFTEQVNDAMLKHDCVLIVEKQQYEHAYAWKHHEKQLIDPTTMTETFLRGEEILMVIVKY